MQAVIALTLKDLRLLTRDRVGFFFTFGFPIFYAMLFGLIFGGTGDDDGAAGVISIAVVDEDDTESSRSLVSALSDAPELSVQASTRDEATEMVRTGRRTAFVLVPAGYGEASERLFWGDPRQLEIGVDPARRAESGMLQGLLTKYAFQQMQAVFSDSEALQKQARQARMLVQAAGAVPGEAQRSLDRFLGSLDTFAGDLGDMQAAGDNSVGQGMTDWTPVEVTVAEITGQQGVGAEPPTSFAVSFPQAIIWGVMACAAAFGISLVIERTSGTLVRLRTAPLTQRQILLGKAGACLLTTIAVATTLLLIATLLGVRPGFGAIPKMALAVLCVSIGFVGIMLVLSVLGKTEAAAGGIGWAILLIMAMLGGGMIPLFLMPSWMQSIASISPVKWSILAFEGAIWRGYSWGEMMLPCGIMIGVGVAGFLLGSTVFKWNTAR